MIRVKICGIRDRAGLEAAAAAGADWAGFVFFPPSPRFVEPDAAAALAEHSPPALRKVGLFVRPSHAEVAAVLDRVPLDVLQVYAKPDAVSRLRDRFGLPVWRAIGVASAADLPPEADADAFVLEAKAPEGATRPGGNARSFDWPLLRRWISPGPWLLAGGLTPANVREAIRATGAQAVDVSSGVETEPGVKDPALIRSFIAAARSG